jgi:hypothetical protein
MVFSATFNNISAISWRSVLLVEETGGPGENHRPIASHWQTLSHDVVHLALIEIRILDYKVLPIRTIDIINSKGYLSYINDKICSNSGSETLRGINMDNEACYLLLIRGPSTPWSYVSWIYKNLRNQCLSRGVQHYVITFVSDFRQVGDFLLVLWFPPPIKMNAMTEILLIVALNTIK